MELGFDLGSWGVAGGCNVSLDMYGAVVQHDRWPAIGSSSIAAVAQRGVEHRCRVAGGGEPVVAYVTDSERLMLHAALAAAAGVV